MLSTPYFSHIITLYSKILDSLKESRISIPQNTVNLKLECNIVIQSLKILFFCFCSNSKKKIPKPKKFFIVVKGIFFSKDIIFKQKRWQEFLWDYPQEFYFNLLIFWYFERNWDRLLTLLEEFEKIIVTFEKSLNTSKLIHLD